MGHVFESNDQTIWCPSRDVALCFLAQVRYFESRLTTGSGLSEVMSDTIDINYRQLARFIAAAGTVTNIDNRSMRLLTKGAIVHLMALLLSGIPLTNDIVALFPDDWINDAMLLSRESMIRIDAKDLPDVPQHRCE
jgi:hypothetical protein